MQSVSTAEVSTTLIPPQLHPDTASRRHSGRIGRSSRRVTSAGLGLLALGLAVSGVVLGTLRSASGEGSGWDPATITLWWPPLAVFGLLSILSLAGAVVLWRRDAAAITRLESKANTLRVLLGITGTGVLVLDHGLRVRVFNPAAEILFGRLADETLDHPVGELIPGLETGARGGEQQSLPRMLEIAGLRNAETFPLRLVLRELERDGEACILVLAEDLSESEEAGERLDFLETHDPLTGLSSRPALERALARLAAAQGELRTPLALCLLDMDRFKMINARCGHASGDKALQQVARLMAIRFPQAGMLARVGSDELAVLFPAPEPEIAESSCEDLLRTVRGFPFACGAHTHDLTASAGLVLIHAREEAGEALRQADIACHLARSRGGARIMVHGREETAQPQGIDLEMVSGIGHALEQDRIALMVQPIYSLHDPSLPPRWEVLVRMRDPDGRSINPGRFIPAAERYVLMPAVDRWVISRVLSQEAARLRAWHAQYPDHYLFAINLSATSLSDAAFLPFMVRQMEENRVPWSSICLEITETAAVSDLGRARALMTGLYEHGCRFAVDDFGTGFAAYSYLKSLPLSYLKIDGAFVRGVHKDPVDRALIESITHVARVLGLETVAEWVESDEVLQTVRTLGVDYAQGHALGTPVELAGMPSDLLVLPSPKREGPG